MKPQINKNCVFYILLLIPVISAILALRTHNFAFKSGVAGGGILILLLMYFNQLKKSKDVWMIFLAFLFSIGGDCFLSNRHGSTGMFIAGIALFFFAHVGYLSFALLNGRLHRSFTLILLTGYLVFFFLMLFPAISDSKLMVATIGYLLISCFSLGAAVGLNTNPWTKWIYIFGIFMVLFSDTIIALNEFAAYRELSFLILPTYYLAQISVTLSIMIKKDICDRNGAKYSCKEE